MVRRELHLVFVLLLIAILLVIFTPFFRPALDQEGASNFVLDDLKSKYPGADIEVMSVTEQLNDHGERYFELKTKVTKYPDRPCPERFHVFYNYPEQNFVPQPKEIITMNCKICTEGICTIAFKEEAIIASHTFPGTGQISSFIESHPEASPSVAENAESWNVIWHDETGGYEIEIHRNGTILHINSLN
ncbi:hypothetical protein JXA56_04205 [Candidatus Micrarchaeota archaeon]|nr:hypothetical protein [Candidatus Micrarchaeota archaeon]